MKPGLLLQKQPRFEVIAAAGRHWKVTEPATEQRKGNLPPHRESELDMLPA